MIGTLLIALQLAAATPSVLSVRAAGGEAVVPLVETNTGAAVPVERLAPVIPLSVRQLSGGHYAISMPGVELDIADQVPFAKVDGVVVPLAAAPFVAGGRLYLPFQVITELLPRYAPSRLRYNAARGELRLLTAEGEPELVAASNTSVKRSTPSRPARRSRRRRVVVDAGHGGPDNGMTGPIGSQWKIYEKDVTLAVAKRLDAALRERGVDVVMTRTTDTLIALYDRGRIANEQHGDLFVSIHVNAANMAWKRPAEARGYETYFLAEAKTEDAKRVEDMENSAVRFETGANAPKGDPLSFIINDMAQNEHLRESSDLAALIQRRLGEMHPGPSRGVKQANLAVLRTSFMPAVLVEIGFGTSTEEARFLTNGTKQREIADAIADATLEYLNHYERRLGASAP